MSSSKWVVNQWGNSNYRLIIGSFRGRISLFVTTQDLSGHSTYWVVWNQRVEVRAHYQG